MGNISPDQKEINLSMCPIDGDEMVWNEPSHSFTDEIYIDSFFIIQLLLENYD